MENSLKVLQDPSIISELMKTDEGKSIVEKMLKLNKQLENLPDTDKIKFHEELGEKIVKTLGILSKEDKGVSLDIYLAVVCVVMFVAFLGKQFF